MNTQDLPVVTLSGAANERGKTHGEALRETIHNLIGVWKETIGQTHGCDPNEFLKEFLSTTSFLEAAQAWTPHLVYETEGIAEGANLDWTTAFSLQLLDEVWWYGRKKLAQGAVQSDNGCSAIGVRADVHGKTVIAQNMDIELWKEGFQALLRLENANDRPDALIYTTAGTVALMGVNRPGLAVCVNTLQQLSTRKDGVPVAFIVRGLLARDDHDDAVDFLRRVPHASGQHYLVASPGKLSSMECSANAVEEMPSDSRVLHTNHPLANEDFVPGREAEGQAPEDNSAIRLHSISRAVTDAAAEVSADHLMKALAAKDDPSNPVSREVETVRPDLGGYTVGGAVFELTTPPVAHIAAGPPSVSEFVSFSF